MPATPPRSTARWTGTTTRSPTRSRSRTRRSAPTRRSTSGSHDFIIIGELGVVSITAPVAIALGVGGMHTVMLDVDAAKIVSGIDWQAVDKDNDKYVLDDQDPQMLLVHESLRTAFKRR
jgi:hypothetical protein